MIQVKNWRYETQMIVVLGLMFGIVFFDRNAMAFLGPFVAKELQLNSTQVGMLGSALSFTWALSGLLVSALADATGKRKAILIVAIVIFSLSSVLSGLAATFSVLLISRLIMGLSEGGILPICQSLLAAESADNRRGINMGVMQNVGSNFFGSFLAPIVLVAIAQAFSWRTGFYVAAAPGLLCALLVILMIREPVAPPASTASRQGGSWLELLRYRNMWVCMAVSIVMVAWMVLGWVFLPFAYPALRGLDPTVSSYLMSSLGISAVVFAFIVPGLSDRIGRKPVVIVFNAVGIVVPLAALYFDGSPWLLGLLVFAGWSASGTFPIFMATIPSETIPPRLMATAIGAVIGVGEILGGVSAPTLAGRAADLHDMRWPMFIMAACAVAGAAFAVFLRETAPVKETSGPALSSAHA
jgi:ACS family hexuronate transporter-like MFS transporter